MDTQYGFKTTQWTAILTAANRKASGSVEALQKLCGVYWVPIYAYARSQGASETEAKDLTQGFFMHLIEKGLSIRSGADGGRFRSFLIRCYRNFATSEWRKGSAVKRGGGAEVIAIDDDEAEGWALSELERDLTPEQIYERKWAQTLLGRVMVRLENEYELIGKLDRFRAMRSCLMGDTSDKNYAAIAQRLEMKEGAVRTAVHRMRANYGRLLREEVLRVVDDPADVDDELRYLLTLLS